jgi:type I restriction enzyme S subunit
MSAPKLRFKEFAVGWKSFSLLDLSSDKTLNNGVFNDQNKVGKGYKLINVLDMYIDRDIDESRLSLLDLSKQEFERNKVKYGDIFFTRSSLVKEGIAYSNVYLGSSNDITYDGHLIKLSPNLEQINSIFLNYGLKTSKVRKQLIQGGKTATMTTIGQKEIASTKIDVPFLQEQTKIASFLSAVDEKISQLTQKHQLLSQYKQGMMQKLFSQQIRFKADDGSEFGEWENILVKEIFDVTRGQVLAVSNTVSVADTDYKYPVFSSQTKQKGLMGFYKKYLFEDALTWTTDGANAGDVNFRKGKFYCTNVCGVLLSKKGYANLCIAEILNKVTHKYVSYVGNPKLMNNVMSEIPITIPSNLEEQTKIANFLSSIDQKIEVVAQQIEQAKQWKKGLLQNMFI